MTIAMISGTSLSIASMVDISERIKAERALRDEIVGKPSRAFIGEQDLENAISTHEAVQEAAAIGVPDPKWGERPMLIVILKPQFQGDGVTDEALRQFMKNCAAQGKIPKYAVPDRYAITQEIPKTSVGKVDKKLLRTLYAQDQLAAS